MRVLLQPHPASQRDANEEIFRQELIVETSDFREELIVAGSTLLELVR